MTAAADTTEQRKWSSNLMFLAAAIGSAVGISNVWKFTYVAGENGGGAFVLVYVCAIAFVALPALIAERGLPLAEAIERVLQHPAVGSKQFLITIGDRSVGGLVARDQMVGPWQVPVADAAVTLADFVGTCGESVIFLGVSRQYNRSSFYPSKRA